MSHASTCRQEAPHVPFLVILCTRTMTTVAVLLHSATTCTTRKGCCVQVLAYTSAGTGALANVANIPTRCAGACGDLRTRGHHIPSQQGKVCVVIWHHAQQIGGTPKHSLQHVTERLTRHTLWHTDGQDMSRSLAHTFGAHVRLDPLRYAHRELVSVNICVTYQATHGSCAMLIRTPSIHRPGSPGHRIRCKRPKGCTAQQAPDHQR